MRCIARCTQILRIRWQSIVLSWRFRIHSRSLHHLFRSRRRSAGCRIAGPVQSPFPSFRVLSLFTWVPRSWCATVSSDERKERGEASHQSFDCSINKRSRSGVRAEESTRNRMHLGALTSVAFAHVTVSVLFDVRRTDSRDRKCTEHVPFRRSLPCYSELHGFCVTIARTEWLTFPAV